MPSQGGDADTGQLLNSENKSHNERRRLEGEKKKSRVGIELIE